MPLDGSGILLGHLEGFAELVVETEGFDVTWGRVRCYISKSKETHPLVKDVTSDPSPCHICKQNDKSEFGCSISP